MDGPPVGGLGDGGLQVTNGGGRVTVIGWRVTDGGFRATMSIPFCQCGGGGSISQASRKRGRWLWDAAVRGQ